MNTIKPQFSKTGNDREKLQISMLSKNTLHAHGIKDLLGNVHCDFHWEVSTQALLEKEPPGIDLLIFESGNELFEDEADMLDVLRERHQDIQVLSIIPDANPWLIQTLGANHIKGMLLLRNVNQNRLKSAIQQLTKTSNYYLDIEINIFTAKLFYKANRLKSPLETSDLTPRQLRILELSAKGYTSEEIADMLHTSRSNITQHRTRIIAQLDVRNMVMAVMKCLGTKQLSLANILSGGEYRA